MHFEQLCGMQEEDDPTFTDAQENSSDEYPHVPLVHIECTNNSRERPSHASFGRRLSIWEEQQLFLPQHPAPCSATNSVDRLRASPPSSLPLSLLPAQLLWPAKSDRPDTLTCVILFSVRLLLHEITTELHTDIHHSALNKKYQGTGVLREHNVKDDSGYRAVFAEQRASASQMEAVKVLTLDTYCVHRKSQLILFVYVGNRKMAGKKELVGPMCEKQ